MRNSGDLGEANAIFKLTELGYKISLPIATSISYDLIADDGILHRVQVKSSTYERKPNKFDVALVTSGGNKSGTGKKSYITKESCDFVFIYTSKGQYLIPSEKVDGVSKITVGNNHWDEYKL